MSEHAAGWRQGPDGRWYPPVSGSDQRSDRSAVPLADLAALVNSGAVTRAIDDIVDDPELAV